VREVDYFASGVPIPFTIYPEFNVSLAVPYIEHPLPTKTKSVLPALWPKQSIHSQFSKAPKKKVSRHAFCSQANTAILLQDAPRNGSRNEVSLASWSWLCRWMSFGQPFLGGICRLGHDWNDCSLLYSLTDLPKVDVKSPLCITYIMICIIEKPITIIIFCCWSSFVDESLAS